MVGSPSTGTLVLNGKVTVDLEGETLRLENGETLTLRPQAFAVLRHLVQNANRLVSKAELLEAIWGGTAVTDDSLVQCIHEIRRALGNERYTLLATVSRRGYRLSLEQSGEHKPRAPSIAVLPFINLSGAEPNDYFADGLVEDIITNLSKIPGLFVIARNSSFGFRGESADPRTISAELHVRYLLQGSVRRHEGRLRINAQLVEGASATLVWADRFEGAAADLFDLQDRLTEQIVGAFVRANLTRDYEAAVEVLDRALALNHNSAMAFGFSSLVGAHSEQHQRAVEHAHKALRLSPLDDPLNYHPYCALALTHLFTHAYGDAARYSALAVRANLGFSIPYAYLAASHVGSGNLEAARSASARGCAGLLRRQLLTHQPVAAAPDGRTRSRVANGGDSRVRLECCTRGGANISPRTTPLEIPSVKFRGLIAAPSLHAAGHCAHLPADMRVAVSGA